MGGVEDQQQDTLGSLGPGVKLGLCFRSVPWHRQASVYLEGYPGVVETEADKGVKIEEALPVVQVVQGVGEEPHEHQEGDDDGSNRCYLDPGGNGPVFGDTGGADTAHDPTHPAHSVPLDTGSLLDH